MRSKCNARTLVLLLVMVTVYAAGWSQDGWSGVINSERGRSAQETWSAEAAPQSTQKVPDKASPSPVTTPDSQQELARAGAVAMAIVPFILEYQHANLYFRQGIDDNPDYTRIEAAIQNGPLPVHQLSLTEKVGSQVIYYTDSKARAEFLTASGQTAYVTPVEYKVEKSLGEQAKHTIAFKDKKGRAIRWLFIPASDPNESWAGVALLPQPLKLLYWTKAAMAGEGTTLQIDTTTILPKEEPELSSPPWYIAYSGNIFFEAIIGGPISGSKTWQVKTAPQTISVGATWVLTDEHNNSRQLKVIAKQGDEVTIQEDEVKASVSPPMTLYMKETPEGLSLKSLAFADGARSLRLSFMPDLNIVGLTRSGKKSSVSFQVDIGDKSKVIEGVLDVEPKGGLVELTGRPNSPEGAKPVILKSKVTLSATGYRIESLNNASADLQQTSITDK